MAIEVPPDISPSDPNRSDVDFVALLPLLARKQHQRRGAAFVADVERLLRPHKQAIERAARNPEWLARFLDAYLHAYNIALVTSSMVKRSAACAAVVSSASADAPETNERDWMLRTLAAMDDRHFAILDGSVRSGTSVAAAPNEPMLQVQRELARAGLIDDGGATDLGRRFAAFIGW